jgi:hypothetical protein
MNTTTPLYRQHSTETVKVNQSCVTVVRLGIKKKEPPAKDAYDEKIRSCYSSLKTWQGATK